MPVSPGVSTFESVHVPMVATLGTMSMSTVHVPMTTVRMPVTAHVMMPMMGIAVDARVGVDDRRTVDNPPGDWTGVHTDIDVHRLSSGGNCEKQGGDSQPERECMTVHG